MSERPDGHIHGCMCDPCIVWRKKKEIAERESKELMDRATKEYEQRRRAKIGSISVAGALREASTNRGES